MYIACSLLCCLSISAISRFPQKRSAVEVRGSSSLTAPLKAILLVSGRFSDRKLQMRFSLNLQSIRAVTWRTLVRTF